MQGRNTSGPGWERARFFALLVVGTCVVSIVQPSLVYAQYTDEKFGEICQAVLNYIENGFGSLLAAVCGLGAIVASAAGGFRVAWALLVVSIGCYIIRAYLGLWFENGCPGG